MTEWARKRFWTRAEAVPVDGGWSVHLDGRPLRTPGKAAMVLPTPALAGMVAAEWAAQGERIDPETMPATRAANSAIDRVAPNLPEVAAIVTAYGETDLLCYRAPGPAGLVARQAAAWDPLLDWAARRFGVRFDIATGVMPRTQPAETLDRLAGWVSELDPFRLTALHDLVALPGSLVVGVAAAEAAFGAGDLWQAARLDDDWQIEHWGQDDEAERVAARRRSAFIEAQRLYLACLPGGNADSFA